MPTAACAAISCPAPTPISARCAPPSANCAPVRHLKTLLADNPSQLKSLAQLQALVTRRVDLMNQALEVYRHGGLDDIIAISRTQEDRTQMDEIRLQVVIMTGEQNELLTTRSAAFYDQYRRAVLLGVGINFAALAVLVLFYNLIRRSFRARLHAERACRIPTSTWNPWWPRVPSSCRCCRAT
jgi:hypothetical protein